MAFLRFYAYDFNEKNKKPNAEKLALTGQVKMVDPVNDTLIRSSFKRFGEIISLFQQLVGVFEMMEERCREMSQILKGLANKDSVIEEELLKSSLPRIF